MPRAVVFAPMGRWLFGLALAGWAFASPTPASAQTSGSRLRVEGVAAWVGGSTRGAVAVPVLRSDVELRARMLVAGRTQRVSLAPLPSALLLATLNLLVGEVLIEREADRLQAEPPSPGAVARERARLAQLAGGEPRLTRLTAMLGVSSEEVDAVARRRAYVEAFLEANLEGNRDVTDAQLERVFASGEHPFIGRDLDEVREVLRVWVATRNREREVARWIQVLRSRSSVRVLAEWTADE